MSNDLIVRDEEKRAVVESNQPVVPATREMLQKVVEAVRADSQADAAAFLVESKVPHGGE